MLLIDLGNTRAKLALLHATEEFISIENNELSTQEILAACDNHAEVAEVTICSVRDELFNQELVTKLQQHDVKAKLLTWTDIEPYLLTTYKTRQSLGLDRQVAMLGAKSYGSSAALVLDLGTASTIDALDAKGRHLGGVIFPGLDLQREALLAGTDDIAINHKVKKTTTFPLSTADAVFSGTLQAWRGGVWAIHDTMATSMAGKVRTYVTGGQAPLLGARNDDSILSEHDLQDSVNLEREPDLLYVPDLVLKGLQFLVEGAS